MRKVVVASTAGTVVEMYDFFLYGTAATLVFAVRCCWWASTAPTTRRAFWTSITQAGAPMGNLLATSVLALLAAVLTEEALLSWGWRVAFWLSAVLIVIGYRVRRNVEDAPLFTEAMAAAEETRHEQTPAVRVLLEYPAAVIRAMGLRVAENILYYIATTFSVTHLSLHVGLPTREVLL